MTGSQARVTNGELLRSLLAALRVRGHGGSKQPLKSRFISGAIISPGQSPSGLCCSQRPRVGGNLALGCSSARAL